MLTLYISLFPIISIIQTRIIITNLKTTLKKMGKNQKSQKNINSQNKNKKHHNHHGRQRHTAVVFDEKERNDYLKGMFGAKNRRRECH